MAELQPLTPHVWIYPCDPDETQPNLGVIITPTQTVLVDAGNGPRHARRLLAELWRIDAPVVTHIIYTHYHWDHTFGAQIFNGTIIAHEKCRDLIVAHYAGRPWSANYIQEEIYQNPARADVLRMMARAVEEWRGFRIVPPQVMFSEQMTLHLDALTLRLQYVGGRHAADSITVEVVEEKVLFIGDSYYKPPAFLRQLDDSPDAEMIESFLARQMSWYIEGHQPPLRYEDAVAVLKQLKGRI